MKYSLLQLDQQELNILSKDFYSLFSNGSFEWSNFVISSPSLARIEENPHFQQTNERTFVYNSEKLYSFIHMR